MTTKFFYTMLLTLVLTTLTISCFCAKVDYTQETKDIYKIDNYKISQKYPAIKAKTPLAKAVNKEIKEILDNSDNNILSKLPNKRHEVEYSAYSTFKVTYSEDKLFSAVIDLSEYTGGARPDNYSRVVNFASNGEQVNRVTLTNLIKSDKASIDNLKYMLVSGINKQRKTYKLNPIDDMDILNENLESFIITPMGINWIFDYTTAGAYYKSVYNVTLDWRELSDILRPNNIATDIIEAYKTMIRINGDIVLPNNQTAPEDAKLQIKLVWVLTDPTRAPKVLETIEKPFARNSVPFDIAFDWKNLDDRNEYQVQFNILLEDSVAYSNSEIMTLTSQGWPKDTMIAMEDIDSQKINAGDTANMGYIRIKTTINHVEKIILPETTYVEYRILDGNTIILKKFESFRMNPKFVDITFSTKKLAKDKDYQLVMLLKDGKETMFSSDPITFTTTTWNQIPKHIRLIGR